MKKLASSSGVSRSPSISALTSADVTSSVGFFARSSPSSRISWASPPAAVRIAVTVSVPSGTYSGSPAPSTTLEASNTKSYWLAGTPIRSHTIFIGSRAAISVTASHSPRSMTSSTIFVAVVATSSVSWASRRGVKPRDTMRRIRACRGSSIPIIEPKNSTNSGGMSGIDVEPLPEQKTCGCRLAS